MHCCLSLHSDLPGAHFFFLDFFFLVLPAALLLLLLDACSFQAEHSNVGYKCLFLIS
jgi:hypothetical protein